jgi:hypothetical protein
MAIRAKCEVTDYEEIKREYLALYHKWREWPLLSRSEMKAAVNIHFVTGHVDIIVKYG